MKKLQEILGLPVIDISDGNEVGTVKDVIINAEKGAIEFFIVYCEDMEINTTVIPTRDVVGIGEYALTIENRDVIREISTVPDAVNMLQKEVKVKETGIMTKKGRLIGKSGDFYVDEDNQCRICALEFKPLSSKEEIKYIPRECVITFGKKVIVVSEDTEEKTVGLESQIQVQSGEYDNGAGAAESTLADRMESVSSPSALTEDTKGDLAEGGVFEEQPFQASQQQSTLSLFEQRQRQYLMGRRATKTIVDPEGNVIIREGEAITGEAIDAAKLHGKLIELVMNNQA